MKIKEGRLKKNYTFGSGRRVNFKRILNNFMDEIISFPL